MRSRQAWKSASVVHRRCCYMHPAQVLRHRRTEPARAEESDVAIRIMRAQCRENALGGRAPRSGIDFMWINPQREVDSELLALGNRERSSFVMATIDGAPGRGNACSTGHFLDHHLQQVSKGLLVGL